MLHQGHYRTCLAALVVGHLGAWLPGAAAQDRLEGSVVDAFGRPLEQVDVRLDGIPVAATDREGRWSVEAPVGSYAVAFSRVGYLPRELPLAGGEAVVLYPPWSGNDPALLTPDGPVALAELPTDAFELPVRAPMDGPTLGPGQALFLIPEGNAEALFRFEEPTATLPPAGRVTRVELVEVFRARGIVVRRTEVAAGRYAWAPPGAMAAGGLTQCRTLSVLSEDQRRLELQGRAAGRLLQIAAAQEQRRADQGTFARDLIALGEFASVAGGYRYLVARDPTSPDKDWRALATPLPGGPGATFAISQGRWPVEVPPGCAIEDWATPLPEGDVFGADRGERALFITTSAQGMRLLYAGEWLQAIEPLGASLYAGPIVETWNNLGKACLELHQWKLARAACRRGIERNETNPSQWVKMCWNNLALAGLDDPQTREQLAALRESQECLERALALDERYRTAARNLAVCRLRLLRLEPGATTARALIEAVDRLERLNAEAGEPLSEDMTTGRDEARRILGR